MAQKKKTTAKKKRPLSKRHVWLRHFTNESSPLTFLNRKESARAAGYRTKNEESLEAIGHENFRILTDDIQIWLDEVGLSENALKSKLYRLMEAKETKFFAHEGIVVDEREVEAIETQRKTLDMALKVKGLYAAEKRELSGPGGKPIKIESDLSPEAEQKLAELINGPAGA